MDFIDGLFGQADGLSRHATSSLEAQSTLRTLTEKPGCPGKLDEERSPRNQELLTWLLNLAEQKVQIAIERVETEQQLQRDALKTLDREQR